MTDTKWTHTHTFKLPGAVPQVFRAWTVAIELQRWFAEHVAIEACEGGGFRFWGRHTYGAPGEKAATAASCATSPTQRWHSSIRSPARQAD